MGHPTKQLNRIVCLVMAFVLFCTSAFPQGRVFAEALETEPTQQTEEATEETQAPEETEEPEETVTEPEPSEEPLPTEETEEPEITDPTEETEFDWWNDWVNAEYDEELEEEEDIDMQALEGDEPPTGVYGSGSYQVNKDPNDYRFHFEYFLPCKNVGNPGYQVAGIDRRNDIYVYLRQGETAYFGSSVYNSCIRYNANGIEEPNMKNEAGSVKVVQSSKSFYTTGEDILIIKPNGLGTEAFDVQQNGIGYIATPTQEKNGPQLNAADREKNSGTGASYSANERYLPLQYTAEADGEYIFHFRSITGWNDSSNPGNELVSAGNWSKAAPAKGQNQSFNYVSAWDLTVVGTDAEGNAEVKEGRAWANYLALNSGAASDKKSSMHLNVMTDDYFIYKVEFSEIVPWGFVFFANNMGFTTTDKTPLSIYHSFYDNDNNLDKMDNPGEENVTIHLPNRADTATQRTYRIFFNTPSPDLQRATQKPNQITDLRFHGLSDSVAQYGQGGTFQFHADQASSVSIEMDIRSSIEKELADPSISAEQRRQLEDYARKGSGMIVLNGSAQVGENSFPWNGKDTNGELVPAGNYARGDIRVFTEEKVGEIHFPLIDAEGLYGGVKIQRLNGETPEGGRTVYDICYNNSPLAYGTIEGASVTPVLSGRYSVLGDGTRSYYFSSSDTLAGSRYFWQDANGNPSYSSRKKMLDDKKISTLVRDDGDYLANKEYRLPYAELTDAQKAEIDAKLSYNTYHHEPVDSSQISMVYSCSSNSGGGNQAGVDIWTYFSTGTKSYDGAADFSVVDIADTGSISGRIFYDGDRNAAYNPSNGIDQAMKDVTVRLVDRTGTPVTHVVSLPQFDEDGYFLRDENGEIVYETTVTKFEVRTAADGIYNFTGVPYAANGSTYYVQAMLNHSQTEVLDYLPTTSPKALKAGYLTVGSIPSTSGPDGTKFTITSRDLEETVTEYTANYTRNADGETVFDSSSGNCQSVTISAKQPTGSFKDIGYVTGVPLEFQRNYQVRKVWGSGTNKLSSITIELYNWDPAHGDIQHEGHGVNSRNGELIDRVTITPNAQGRMEYTWKNLDSRLQYFFTEYYTRTKEDGTVLTNDKGEPRLVLIGSTLPVYSQEPNTGDEYYTELGSMVDKDYTYHGHKLAEERKHYYGDGLEHVDAASEREKQTSQNTNALLYDMTYNLTASGDTNILTLTNQQTYDEREYYVWLGHERELPNFVAKSTISANGTRTTTPVKLERCTELHDGHSSDFHIKGLTITSLDASFTDNTEGNATDTFRFDGDHSTAVYFTATDQIYKTGTGTRTYKVEYTVDRDGRALPVKIVDGKPVPTDTDIVDYRTYSWTLTIHVYDVQPDEVFYYDPYGSEILVQEGLSAGEGLSWQWDTTFIDGKEVPVYVNDDSRTRETADNGEVSGTNAVLGNDVIRVPLYKEAVQHTMGSCADLVGIAYSPDGIYANDADAKKLTFWDTNESVNKTVMTSLRWDEYGRHNGIGGDGWANAIGKGGTLEVELNTPRMLPVTKGQDHANYGEMVFVPNGTYAGADGDVFYYKVVVFSEDVTKDHRAYDTLDATQGVEMYTYLRFVPVDLHAEVIIRKELVGNMAETDRSFPVEFVLEKPKNTAVKEDITYSSGYFSQDNVDGRAPSGTIPASYWQKNSKYTNVVWLYPGQSIRIENLPLHMTYTVREQDDRLSVDSYHVPVFVFDNPEETGDEVHRGILWSNNYATGRVSDVLDILTIRNEKNVDLDVGVILDNKPYVLLSALCCAGFVLLAAKRHLRRNEEE